MTKHNDLQLRAKYKYGPPSLDAMIIDPRGITGGHGEDDDIIPEIDWTTTPEGEFLQRTTLSILLIQNKGNKNE